MPRLIAFCILAAMGGAVVYAVFAQLTGLEPSLIGIPVGLAVGQLIYHAAAKQGGRRFQALAAFLAFFAFDLTYYAPGIAGVVMKGGISVPAFAFLIFITLISPVMDAQNGFIGQFMVF